MYPSSINERYLDEVADCLRAGGIIIYPTDTLYAVGCVLAAMHLTTVRLNGSAGSKV